MEGQKRPDTVPRMPAKKKPTRSMSDAHKAALVTGREQGRAVRAYLEALESNKPKRGRRRTPESIEKRLEAIADLIERTDPLTRVQLFQERLDLEAELVAGSTQVDLAGLEEGFIAVAAAYAGRKGISYSAWREIGVPAATLRAAGITRNAT